MAIALVGQIGTLADKASGTSKDIPVGAAGVQVGNKIIVLICNSTSGGTVSGVTDSKGNTYTVDVPTVANGTADFLTIASADVTTGLVSGDTITVTWSVATGIHSLGAWEFSGLATGGADQTATATGSGTALSVGPTAATTQADELVVAAFATNAIDSGWTPGAGYTDLGEVGNVGGTGQQRTLNPEYKIVSATGTQSAAGTADSGASSWAGGIATYKAATGGPTTQTIDAGNVPSAAAVRGADVTPAPVTLGVGEVASASAVRGANLTPAPVTLGAGKVASAAAVRGADLTPGPASLATGKVSSPAAVRGANLAPAPVTLTVGHITSTAAVRGADVTGAGSAIHAGKVPAADTVRGATLTPGPVTVDGGKVASSSATRGVTLTPAAVTLTVGKVADASMVRGASVTAGVPLRLSHLELSAKARSLELQAAAPSLALSARARNLQLEAEIQ